MVIWRKLNVSLENVCFSSPIGFTIRETWARLCLVLCFQRGWMMNIRWLTVFSARPPSGSSACPPPDTRCGQPTQPPAVWGERKIWCSFHWPIRHSTWIYTAINYPIVCPKKYFLVSYRDMPYKNGKACLHTQ